MSRLGSDKRITSGFQERAEALIGVISERDAAISALEYEVRRLTIELQKQTKVGEKTPTAASVAVTMRWPAGSSSRHRGKGGL